MGRFTTVQFGNRAGSVNKLQNCPRLIGWNVSPAVTMTTVRSYADAARDVSDAEACTLALKYRERKSLIDKDLKKYYPPLLSVRHPNVTRIGEFREKYHDYDFTQLPNNRSNSNVSVEGRIHSIRKAGRAMYFVDLIQDGHKVQLVIGNRLLGVSIEEFDRMHSFFRKGDAVVCTGYPSITKVGELSVKLCKPMQLVAPSLKSTLIPTKLVSRSLINKNRVLNYIVSDESRLRVLIKSHIIQAVRDFFLRHHFVEVQTPILAGYGTGANAEPFRTISNALDAETCLQLRVAPELWLKRLIIGGFDRVFEIGQSFRNEGIDLTHNPEFTTCEFYQTFTTLDELLLLSEGLLTDVYSALESKKPALPLLQRLLPELVSLKHGSFPRFEFIPTLERQTMLKLPELLTSENLIEYHKQLNLDLPKVISPASLLDNLSSNYLEGLSVGKNTPIFIYNQPAAMAPLSKSTLVEYEGRRYDISLRFELFINGKEYMNAYEEENCPADQAAKFKLQQLTKSEYLDNEMLIPDWEYVSLMEYGLPPTGGWGCGIDRLAMLFSGTSRIEDVLAFGSLRDVVRQ